MSLKVFKFGGASISTVERMKQLIPILKSSEYTKLVIVVSALGKVTNALEEITKMHFEDCDKALQLLEELKQKHFQICDELFENSKEIKDIINNHFVEIHWMIEDDPMDSYDYNYDQIVSIGELVSSSIVAYLLNQNGLTTKWVDARGMIQTSAQFREGEVNWDATKLNIEKIVEPLLNDFIVVTQGFIGSTVDNETTTLGREGSDFSGAIIANCLNAESLTIWKDVPGVLNSDPSIQNDVVKFDCLTYREAVEMTYYGAKVIHPKTIKPLQNRGIPLYVRSFINIENEGTLIHDRCKMRFQKAIYTQKNKQSLLHFYVKDFSFFGEKQVIKVMNVFDKHHIQINLMQRGAIHCSFIINSNVPAIEQVMNELSKDFNIDLDNDLQLDTLRHYQKSDIEHLKAEKSIILEQQNEITYQVVYRPT